MIVVGVVASLAVVWLNFPRAPLWEGFGYGFLLLLVAGIPVITTGLVYLLTVTSRWVLNSQQPARRALALSPIASAGSLVTSIYSWTFGLLIFGATTAIYGILVARQVSAISRSAS